MTDPDHITPEEAAEILGVNREATAAAMERAYSEKLEALEKKIAQAATAALRNKYRTALARLKSAREVLEAQDSGLDLPSLEMTSVDEPARTPAAPPLLAAAVPVPVAAVAEPVPAPVREAKPKKPFPLAAVLGVVAALALAGGVTAYLKREDLSGFAGDYRRRVNYETVKFDFAVTVDKKGNITGQSQRANGSGKPSLITGKVDARGAVTAKGDGTAQYTGTIEGDQMKLEEKLSQKTFLFSLGKGTSLPAAPPQAEFAGTYRASSVEYPSGHKFAYEFNLTENGALSGSFHDLNNGPDIPVAGTVTDYGGIDAQTVAAAADGTRTTYSGTVENDTILLKETLAQGKIFNFKLTKGGPASGAAPSPAAGFSGRYFAPSIEYPGGKKYEFEFKVASSGTITGYYRKLDSDRQYPISGTMDAKGKLEAATPDRATTYTGAMDGTTLVLSEKLPDNAGVFTIKLKKTP